MGQYLLHSRYCSLVLGEVEGTVTVFIFTMSYFILLRRISSFYLSSSRASSRSTN